MANCPGCGGAVKFDIETGKLKCTACSNLYSPYDESMSARPEEQNIPGDENGSTYVATSYTCPQCGGELCSTDYDLSGNCAFCGSQVVYESKLVRHKKPEFIIPFGVTKEECRNFYAESVRKNPFAPKELRDPDFIDGFRGIYVPYWVYDIVEDGSFSCEGTRTEHHSDYDYVYTDQIKATNCSEFKHIMHDASSVFQDDLSEKVEPFEMIPNPDVHRTSPELKEFSTGFFAGFYAEPANVDQSVYEDYARNIAEEKTSDYVKSHGKLKKYSFKLSNEDLGTRIEKCTLAMMPVWFLSYRKNNRVAYAAVNGQTGRVVSDMPIDRGAFLKRFFIAAIIIFAVLMFTTILPVSVTLLSVVMAAIVTGYCMEDTVVLKGRSGDGKTGRLRERLGSGISLIAFIVVILLILIFKIIFKIDPDFVTIVDPNVFALISIPVNIVHLICLIIQLIYLSNIKQDKTAAHYFCPVLNFAAGLAGSAVLIAAPVQDIWYYLTGAAVLVTELVSFVFIIKNFNRIATRPLPQFSIHKGGDDSAK